MLGAGELAGEQKNCLKFAKIVLSDMLGYPIDDLLFEKDRVEFQYRGNGDGGAGVCFEVKGTATRDLFAPQRRAKTGHYAPVKRLWDYMGSTGAGYGICTNCRRFVLLARETGTQKYYEFDFEEVGRAPQSSRSSSRSSRESRSTGALWGAPGTKPPTRRGS